MLDGRRLVAWWSLSFVVSVSPSSDVCQTPKMTQSTSAHTASATCHQQRLGSFDSISRLLTLILPQDAQEVMHVQQDMQ